MWQEVERKLILVFLSIIMGICLYLAYNGTGSLKYAAAISFSSLMVFTMIIFAIAEIRKRAQQAAREYEESINSFTARRRNKTSSPN